MSAYHDHRDLTKAATIAHINARARSSFTSDTILVSKKSECFESPCGVLFVKSDLFKKELTSKLASRSVTVAKHEKAGAQMAL